MKNYRYGKFRFSDYYLSWFSIAWLLFLTVASVILELPTVFIIFPFFLVFAWLWVILSPQCEKFIICADSIIVTRGKITRRITLPSELTLVVSYADVCPPFAIRTPVGNQTHILKDKIAVSVLYKMPLDDVVIALHHNHVKKLTASRIERVFADNRFIYSFVCDQSLFDELIANKNCLVIIPESLVGTILIDTNYVNLYIDKDQP